MKRLLATLCLWLILLLPAAGHAFDPPGLADDAAAYAAAIRAKAPPQANPKARDAALRQARDALSKGDAARAVESFERAIAEGGPQAALWLALSDALDKAGKAERALQTAFLAYSDQAGIDERNTALLRMADLLESTLDRPRPALDALEELRDRGYADPALEPRMAGLRARIGLALTGVRVNAEDEQPRICLEFSGALSQAEQIRYQDFVGIEPPVPLAVEAQDERLCLTGVAHGNAYQVTVRQGLPGQNGLALRRDETQQVRIGDRPPFVAFRGRTFILPRGDDGGLPVVTVNLDAVTITVYRVNDRNLTPVAGRQTLLEPLNAYEAEQFSESDGERLWQGRLETRGERNKPVITGLPIRQTLGPLKPGLYVVTAEPVDVASRDTPWTKATQWLMVSDLGLTSMVGADGVTVFARSFASARPAAGIEVRLVARNNGELGRVATDATGRASFPPGLARGTGGNAPSMVMAYGPDGDFAMQDLTATAFDLSDRGVGGRTPPGPLDAWLHTERGVYRPGETVHLAGLLRDDRTVAVETVPLTVKVMRPSGTEFLSTVIKNTLSGGFTLPFTLARTAPLGIWSVLAYSDPEAEPIGRLTFQVEDFVPERLAVAIAPSAPVLRPDQPFEAVVTSRFLYGPPAAGLDGTAELILSVDPDPYPALPGYRFGLVQDETTPRRIDLTLPASDAQGVARLAVPLAELPDTTRPLRAEIRVAVTEPGGRPSRQSITVPVRTHDFAVGIRPRFDGTRLNEGQEAAFDLIAVDAQGRAVARKGLRYELFAEHTSFQWYMRDGRYTYHTRVRDESLKAGTLDIGADRPALQNFAALPFGRYRIEVSDRTTGVASSLRFNTGWATQPEAGETPDMVEVTADKPSYGHGDTARVRIVPPFAGEVLLTVATDRIIEARNITVPAEGATVEVPVDATAWGSGAYVTATVFRPPAKGQEHQPVRAIGLTWLAIDPAARTLAVELAAPTVVRPRGPVEVPVRVTGSGGPLEEAFVTLAAVDEGILQLTDFVSPDPGRHFFGKRALGLDIRDDYGRLIDTVPATGVLRQGGDGSGGTGLAVVPFTIVSLFSGPVRLAADGSATIRLDIPDFNGELRLMAVAFDRSRMGAAAGTLTVRDALVAEATLPRFLAPGDDSQLTLSLHNAEAPAGGYRVSVTTEGPLAVDNGGFAVDLAPGARHAATLPLHGTAAGIGTVTVRVDGPTAGGQAVAIERQFRLQVRPARPVETAFTVQRLAPGATAEAGTALLAGYVPGTTALSLSYSAAPPFNVPGLLRALDRYPYGCLEQVTSRALPLLYVNDVALALGAEHTPAEHKPAEHKPAEHKPAEHKPDDGIAARIDQAIVQVLDKQRHDGAFGVWGARGEANPWLNAYALEFLARAKARGHAVPEAPYLAGLNGLRQTLLDGGNEPADLAARAYALHVLALAGVAAPGPARYFHDAVLDALPTPLSRAQVGAALARLGDRDRAESAFRAALARLAREPWPQDYGSTVRDAAAIATLLSEAGMLTDQLATLIDRLPASDTAVDRTSTQEQAWLVLAASSLMTGTTPLRLTVAGKPAPAGDPVHLVPTGAQLAGGLPVHNAGGAAIWQAVSVSGVPAQPRPARHEGLRVKRHFFNRDGSPLNLDQIRQNDVFVIVLEGEATTKLYHQVLVVNPLPAGWEIENSRLGGEDTDALSWLGELSETTMVEARDDRYVAALDLTEEVAKFRLAYLVRAVTPGNYELPGAMIEDMYKPRFVSRQAVGRITVLPPQPR